MTLPGCPSVEALTQFDSGRLNETHAAEISGHLEECPLCLETLDGLGALTFPGLAANLENGASTRITEETAYHIIEPIIHGISNRSIDPPLRSYEVLLPGTQIGPYRIEKLLGQGGMGVVYQAWHTRLHRRVALKLLSSVQAAHHQSLQRFEREMATVGQFNHPQVVTGLDAGDYEGTYFLAMELVQGPNLSQVLAACGPLSLPDACEIIRQVAIGLEYVHQHGLLHRDLKPSNLMLTCTDGGAMLVKILDLGLARFSGKYQPVSAITSAGQILGTLEFLAPEMGGNDEDLAPRADLYSLGATFYKLLTGNAPLSAQDYPTPIQLLTAIANETPAPIAQKAAVPRKLARLIHSLLAKNPDRRPPSAQAVADQLAPYARKSNLHALFEQCQMASLPPNQNVGLIPHHGTSSPSNVADANSNKSKPPNGPIHRSYGLAFAAVLVLLIAAGIIWLKTDGGYLKIVAEPDVEITLQILNDGQVIDSLNVSQVDQAIWYRAGIYQLRLPLERKAEFELSNSEFTLKHRRKQVVKITKIKDPPFKVSPSNRPVDAVQPQPAKSPRSLQLTHFNLTEAQNYQRDWAKSVGLPLEKTVELPGGVPMSFRLIPPGEFLMGSTDAELDEFTAQSKAWNDLWGLSHIPRERFQHRVRISKPFYFAKFEMTRAQWKSITGNDPSNPSYHKGDPTVMPVVDVSWNDCQAMIGVLNQRFNDSAVSFALATEAQWEYACRAGTTTPFFFGNLEKASQDTFWYFGNRNRIEQPVGLLKPNSWGLFDMHGNVHEWVQDRGGKPYAEDKLVVDPADSLDESHGNDHRIMRGGSVWDPPTACRSAFRGYRPPDYRFGALGLRLTMSMKPNEEAAE